MKSAGGINGRTIQVADKGLNCAENIHEAIKRRDGYIFSKSVKALPQTEKKWLLLDSGNSCDRNDPNMWTDVKDSDGTIRYRYKSCVDVFPYEYKDSTGKKHSFTIEEKRVVTYNPQLASKQIFEIDR